MAAQLIRELFIAGTDQSGQAEIDVVEEFIAAVLGVDGQGYFTLKSRGEVYQIQQLLFGCLSLHSQLAKLTFGRSKLPQRLLLNLRMWSKRVPSRRQYYVPLETPAARGR